MSEPAEVIPITERPSTQDQNHVHVVQHASARTEDHDDDHIDERWLVSYSDMMTLLFGLFVMLYSLAMEHKGDIDQALTQIQEGESRQSEPTREELKKIVADSTLKIELLERKLAQTDLDRTEHEKMKQNYQAISQQLQGALAQVESLTQASAGAKNSAALHSELQKTKQELQQKSERLARLEQQLDALQARLQAQAQAQAAQKNGAHSAQLQEKRLAELERENSAIKNQLTVAVKKLEMQAAKPVASSENFLMLILSWTTEKHDLDMVVTDPQGHSFNFENRTFQKIPGEFVIDSRTGPGIEVFQAPNPLQGTYELKVDFYNAYGNKQDAEAKISIVTRHGEKKINSFKLNRASGKTKTFKFTLNSQGAVEGI